MGHWQQGVVTDGIPHKLSAVQSCGVLIHKSAMFLQGRPSLLLHPFQAAVCASGMGCCTGVSQVGLCEHQARRSTWSCVRAVREDDRSGLRLLS